MISYFVYFYVVSAIFPSFRDVWLCFYSQKCLPPFQLLKKHLRELKSFNIFIILSLVFWERIFYLYLSIFFITRSSILQVCSHSSCIFMVLFVATFVNGILSIIISTYLFIYLFLLLLFALSHSNQLLLFSMDCFGFSGHMISLSVR